MSLHGDPTPEEQPYPLPRDWLYEEAGNDELRVVDYSLQNRWAALEWKEPVAYPEEGEATSITCTAEYVFNEKGLPQYFRKKDQSGCTEVALSGDNNMTVALNSAYTHIQFLPHGELSPQTFEEKLGAVRYTKEGALDLVEFGTLFMEGTRTQKPIYSVEGVELTRADSTTTNAIPKFKLDHLLHEDEYDATDNRWLDYTSTILYEGYDEDGDYDEESSTSYTLFPRNEELPTSAIDWNIQDVKQKDETAEKVLEATQSIRLNDKLFKKTIAAPLEAPMQEIKAVLEAPTTKPLGNPAAELPWIAKLKPLIKAAIKPSINPLDTSTFSAK